MDGRMYVYDCADGGHLTNVRPLSHDSMKSGVRSIAQCNNLVFSGAEDGSVAAWDISKETVVASAQVHAHIVSALCAFGDLVRLSCL
jgi:N-acetylglucosamine kinase-like BadF-type ATPase